MKKLLFSLTSGIIFLLVASSSYSTLIGDTVTIGHYYPTPFTLEYPSSIASVQVGSGIEFSYDNDPTNPNGVAPRGDWYDVDITENTIDIIFKTNGTKSLTGFDGISIFSLDDSSGGDLLSANIISKTNPLWDPGFVVSSPAPTTLPSLENGIDINLAGLTYNIGGRISFGLQFDPGSGPGPGPGPGPNPVPEPTTMLLLGTGLAGLVGVRYRRKKK